MGSSLFPCAAAKLVELLNPEHAPAFRQVRQVAGVGRLLSRNAFTISTYFLARASIRASSPLATAFGSTSEPPIPNAQAPASRNSRAVSRFTPPVGIRRICGSGALIARKYFGPVNSLGKILTISAPASQAATISVGVNAPGITSLL